MATNIVTGCGLFLLCVCLLAGVRAGKYDEKNGRHNITMGNRGYRDIIVFQDSPKVDGSWIPYPKVQSHDVCYPPKGSHPARFSISAFNVTDLVPRGEGGYAYIKEGGVGWGKLCLHLKTQRGKGYHFNIIGYGRYI